jgi:acid stress-induced BolA-like protein IbaG/YrbA
MADGSVREKVRERLEQALAGSVQVRDLTGTDNHFEVRVVSAAFEGKSAIERHKLVYAPLLDWIENDTVHALSVRAYTPEQHASLNGSR